MSSVLCRTETSIALGDRPRLTARAAAVPAAPVRRAFFLPGRLPATARLALTGGAPALEAVAPELGRPVRPMLASPVRETPPVARAASSRARPGPARRSRRPR